MSPLLSAVPGVSHRFFQRIGGTSPSPWRGLNTSYDTSDAPARVDENLARVRFQIGVPKDALYAVTQVHGSAVLVVSGEEDPLELRVSQADALVTTTRDVAVAVRTADCAPILLALDDGSAVAAVHAGWRGAVGGVIENAVRELCARGSASSASRVIAAVGPCIGMDAFEVGPEVVEGAARALAVDIAMLKQRGIARDGAADRPADRAHVDLAALVLAVLARCGVERAERIGGCTVTEENAYYSHRRDVTVGKASETGRQMAAIALTSPPDLDDEMFR